jgi:hypothetical protein
MQTQWFDPLTKKVGGPLTPLTPWNRSHWLIQAPIVVTVVPYIAEMTS